MKVWLDGLLCFSLVEYYVAIKNDLPKVCSNKEIVLLPDINSEKKIQNLAECLYINNTYSYMSFIWKNTRKGV